MIRTARKVSEESSAESGLRSAQTSKHDRARLIHLTVFPEAIRQWTSAMTPADRETLDNHEVDDAYRNLADMFNNYEDVTFQNATIQYKDDAPISPYQARPEMESLAAYCWELNPSDPTRCDRDGAWIRKQWRELRTTLTKIRENFKKSGNQDAENIYDEWTKFSSHFGDVYTYAIAVINWCGMDHFGKALPDDLQIDTGKTDTHKPPKRKASDSIGAMNRARQRKRRKELTSPGSSVSSGDGTPNDISEMLEILEEHEEAQREQKASELQLSALTYLANKGDEEALAAIRKIAFGSK